MVRTEIGLRREFGGRVKECDINWFMHLGKSCRQKKVKEGFSELTFIHATVFLL